MKAKNFKPRANYLLTTSHLVKKPTSLILTGNDTPTIKEIQQVLAVGDNTDIKVGDWIVLDLSRFIKQVKVKSTIRAGVGGQDMIKEEIVIPFFAIPGDDTPYLKISDREIEGTIPDFNALPKEVKEYTTVKDFHAGQEALKEATEKIMADERKKIDTAGKPKNERKGPGIAKTETTKSRI